MFKKFITLIFLSLSVCSLSNSIAASATKHALLVGVGAYDPSTGWDQLSSVNDVELIRNTLLTQGFEEQNIHTLLDAEVSKKTLFQIFEHHLINQVKKGDIVVFHFSGHGQQVQDQNGDELDGLDEAIVPFDSPKNYSEGQYEGEHLIRDEELGSLFVRLRKKLGPKGHLLVLMDACHSGTGTRGLGKARGTDVLMASADYKKRLNLKSTDLQQSDIAENKSKGLAPMVSIFSSTARQLSYELNLDGGKSYGLLSYAFCKYFNGLNGQITYAGLMAQIKMFIASETSLQTPQVEGPDELIVLTGNTIVKSNYFTIKDWVNKSTVLLASGSFHGLHTGTKVDLYPIDIRDPSRQNRVSKGTIVYTEPFLSEIELETPLNKDIAMASWVYITEKNLGSLTQNIQIDLPSEDFLKELTDLIKEAPFLKIVPTHGDLILRQSDDNIQLINRDQLILLESNEVSASQVISQALLNAQAQFLRTLEMNDDRFKAEIKLLVDKKEKEFFQVGEEIVIKIENTGTHAFYFSLLDIQPDNLFNVIPLSENTRSNEEYYLEPGKTFNSQLMAIGNPTGTEVFKLVMTPEPIDLSTIILNQGNTTKGIHNHPLEILIAETYKNTNTNNMRSGTAGICTKVFQIKP